MFSILDPYLNYIRLGALGLSYLAVAWAVHEWDKSRVVAAQNVILQKQMSEVEHVRVVHNKVSALPIGDAGTQLLRDWSR